MEALKEAIEDIEEISILIKEWEDSEKRLMETKNISDHFDQIVLEDRNNTGSEETGNSSNVPLRKICSKSSSVNSSNSKNYKNKNLSKNVADIKSKSSLNTYLSKGDNSSCSKAVERRIHQIENYENILRQYKAPTEKVLFLQSLNNSENN